VRPDPSTELSPVQEEYNRLLSQHCNPPENSIAYLAGLHSLVARYRDNPVMIDGDECYPMAIQMLDEMIATAQRKNDDAFFVRYAQAIKMAGEPRRRSLLALIVGAWIDLLEEYRRPPAPLEVKVKLGLTRGGPLWVKFGRRHVRRAFQAASGLFGSAG
jgi:hypothetical protein